MLPRIPFLVLVCCWWQWGSISMLAPTVCLAQEDYHQENHQAEEQYYDDNSNEYQQDNNQEYHDDNQENYQNNQGDTHYEEQQYHEEHNEYREDNHEDHNDNQWEEEHNTPQGNHDNNYEQQDDHHEEQHQQDGNPQEHYENNQGDHYDSNPEHSSDTPEEYQNNDQHREEYYQDNQNEERQEEYHNNEQEQEEYYENRNDEHHEEYQHNDQQQKEHYDDNRNDENQEEYHHNDQRQEEHYDDNHNNENQEEYHDSDQNGEESYDDNQNEEYQGRDASLDEPTYDDPSYPEPQQLNDNDQPVEEIVDYESAEQPEVQDEDEPREVYDDYQQPEFDPSDIDDEPGVDFSWPMHHFRNRHPTAEERERRSRRHWQFLKGCSNHYSVEECKTSDAERMTMNLRQPRILMNYTSAGYAKMQAPKGVSSMLQNFYRKHSNRQVRENWPPGNIYTNHWSSPVKLLPVSGLPHTQGQVDPQPSLSPQQRKDIISQIQPILEAWCKMPLVPTSLYGIRTYKRGSILAPHVDRLPLVISVIINVDQEVVEDWPLEIIDHSGRATNVTMKPGDMVLYESATVVHGRPYPLNGQTYSNLFLHFEPVGYSERHHNSADQKKRRKDPKALFEEALAKQQQADTRELNSWVQKQHDRPYYVLPKNDEQWEQKYVYVKRKEKKKPKKNSKSSKKDDWEKDVDERLFHNLAAKGLLLKMKELVMEDPAIITRKDNNGWLALHEAARAGQTHVVEYLCKLMETSEINTRTNGGRGATPTWWAMHMFAKDHPTVRTLLKYGGKSIAPNSSNNKKT